METPTTFGKRTSTKSLRNSKLSPEFNVRKKMEKKDGFTTIKIAEPAFYIAGNKTEGYRLTFGNKVVSTKKFEGVKDATKYLATMPWEVVLTATAVFIDQIFENRKANKNNTSKNQE